MTKELPEYGSELETLCINTIRTLSMDAVQKANSGHPGAPMGLAPAAYVLWMQFMNHNPKNPAWLDRDRFVLSGGHASMLLYSLLHLTGYDVSLEDLKNFRQWGSKTPGHPELGHTSGVETTTGPLGQGFANAVGMAMAERHLAACYNKQGDDIVDHYTYMMCGDGDMMEGVASEAASLAGHLGLSKLICLYDDNKISIEGSTDIAFTEDVAKRFEAYHWHVLKVADGCDVRAIAEAIKAAKAETSKPSLIAIRTIIACGSPNKQGSCEAHGSPLGEAEVRLTKKNLNWDEKASFLVPENALSVFRKTLESGAEAEAAWMEKFSDYIHKYPDMAKKWADAMSGYLTDGWDSDIPKYTPADKPVSTRVASGKVLNAIARNLPTLMGGSADLAPSNMTFLDGLPEFQKDHYEGRNIRFGVREHALGSILSGMFLHNGIRPYGGTFLVFADYMRPAIRVASLMKLPVIYVFTHDSIAVGEDGPTHQPIEHLASLRAIPGLTVIRPADANETAEAWRQALITSNGPTALIFSRQNLPILAGEGYKTGVSKGAYVASDCQGKPELILIATGSEVAVTLKAKVELESQNVKVRVVSMPSWELFDKMPKKYRDEILPPDVEKRLAVEAGIPMGWEKYVGSKGATVCITGYGASAPGNVVMEKYGFTSENIVEKALECLKG
ncbi:MAG: transketolase [Desulfobacteraceae bacterium]|nr:transketolase [Desulfobacteraceae bacterium]